MPVPRPPKPTRKTWPYAVVAVLVLAVNAGWPAADVIKLATVLLVLIALVVRAGPDDS
ncbi:MULTISPECIES: hypothetical protein [unclassified Streptomyces]|uniref:hypothetical protein n=1 Tax=unclassified Streptomyces TaxID=2593676 RepID=UPI0035E341F0